MTTADSPPVMPRRTPRVHLAYDLIVRGVRQSVQLPFVIGVLADLSGRPAEPLPPFYERKFHEINAENFDRCLRASRPRVSFQVPNTLSGEGYLYGDITFERMDDFLPQMVAARVPGLGQLSELREQLGSLMQHLRGNEEARALLRDLLDEPALMLDILRRENVTAGQFACIEFRGTSLESLVYRAFRPGSDRARDAIERGVQSLAKCCLTLGFRIDADLNAMIEALVTNLDSKIAEQLNLILHHDDFQRLEGTWRGLHYLVLNTETDETLKLRVLNISKTELARTLHRYRGSAWDRSPLFERVCVEAFGQFGGEPFGALIGDYYFNQDASDIALLRDISKVAAAGRTPFIAAAAPSLMLMSSWDELDQPRNIARIFDASEYAAWRTLRESEDSRYLFLTMPRFLARAPYRPTSESAAGFVINEDTRFGGSAAHVWSNAAYAMAANIARAFRIHGWCSRIAGMQSGGAVERLPTHTETMQDGTVESAGPTEIFISEQLEAELASLGLLVLVYRKESRLAAFESARSLHKPACHDDHAFNEDNMVMTSLACLLAHNRFAHYIHRILRDKGDSLTDREAAQACIDDWIASYIDTDPAHSTAMIKAQRPLTAAKVSVEYARSGPARYMASLQLRTH
jgi:type VI secretion system protein ImpC